MNFTKLFIFSKLAVSPYINRFLQPDSIIPDLSNPQSWNRYSYVTNRPVNFSDPTGHDYDCGVLLCPEDMRDDSDEGGSGGPEPELEKKKKEAEEQLEFCTTGINPLAPQCDVPEQDTLSPLPKHFALIFPWQIDHLDAGGFTGDITGCFIIICGTVGLSWVKNPKWGEDTIFFNVGGGQGLGWGSAGSVGAILAYDAPYNSDLVGLATNYGANISTPVGGGQITYAKSASSSVSRNYPQTYTASYSLGGQASGHQYITNSIPLVTCIWGKNCK